MHMHMHTLHSPIKAPFRNAKYYKFRFRSKYWDQLFSMEEKVPLKTINLFCVKHPRTMTNI